MKPIVKTKQRRGGGETRRTNETKQRRGEGERKRINETHNRNQADHIRKKNKKLLRFFKFT